MWLTHASGRKLADDAWERTPEQREVCQVLEKVANEVGAKGVTAGASLLCKSFYGIV